MQESKTADAPHLFCASISPAFDQHMNALLSVIKETKALPKSYPAFRFAPESKAHFGTTLKAWGEQEVIRALFYLVENMCAKTLTELEQTYDVQTPSLAQERDALCEALLCIFDVLAPHRSAFHILYTRALTSGIYAPLLYKHGERMTENVLKESHLALKDFPGCRIAVFGIFLKSYMAFLEDDVHLSGTMASIHKTLDALAPFIKPLQKIYSRYSENLNT